MRNRVAFGIYEDRSSLTACVLGSLGYVLAIDLTILFGWALVEVFINLMESRQYRPLAWLLAITVAAAAVLAVWRWLKPSHFGVAAVANGSLNLLPLAIVDAGLLAAVLWIADQFGRSFNTPLLLFCQVLFHKLAR